MPSLLIGAPSIAQDRRQAVNSLSKAFPKPSNGLALAAIGAVWHSTAVDGVKAGLPTAFAERFLLPMGVIARLRLVACGWKNPGDNFKRADDKAWWQRPYDLPQTFWPTMGTYVDILDKNEVGGGWNFDQHIADGDPVAVSSELENALTDLRTIQDAKADICLPYIPSSTRGALPSPNLVCLAKIKGEKDVKPVTDELITLFGISLPWWAWVALGYVASRTVSKR